jgi:hypothetical protein
LRPGLTLAAAGEHTLVFGEDTGPRRPAAPIAPYRPLAAKVSQMRAEGRCGLLIDTPGMQRPSPLGEQEGTLLAQGRTTGCRRT